MLEAAEDDGISGDASQPSSSSSLYAPKPAYDQLEVYSGDGAVAVIPAKQRRSGLSALHQAEILFEVSAASSTGATNGLRSQPSNVSAPSSDASFPNTRSSEASPNTGAIGGVTTTPALPSSVMAFVPSLAGAARCQVPVRDGVGDLQRRRAEVTVEVTAAMEHVPLKPSSSCSTSSLDDSSAGGGSVTGARDTATALPSSSTNAAVPWPDLPASPTMARLQDAGLPPSTPISKLLPNELESVFRRVELGMKIDRVTLFERLEVLRRQRDTAHANYYRELDTVNTHMMSVDGECLKGDLGAELVCLKRSLAVLAVSVESLVSAAQQWAAVQHEWSCSRAVEALQTYTDHTIALLAQANKQIKHLNTLVPPPCPTLASPRLRATSLNPPQEQRRLSLSPGSRPPGSPRLLRSSSIAAGSRRASLQPNIKPFKEPIKPHHLSGGGGLVPALNLARVSSIVEEGATPSDEQENAPPSKCSPPSSASGTLTNTPASSTLSSTIAPTASVINGQSLTNSASGGGTDGEPVEGNIAALTEEALARLQNFYRRAVEMPQGEADDLLDDEFGDPEDEDLVDLDDDLMDELLEYEASHQAKRCPPSNLPGTADSIFHTRTSAMAASVCSCLRGSEEWPWTRQETFQRTRYFSCCALIVVALCLLVACILACPLVQHAEDGLHCRQGWSFLFNPCHPFVQVTYIGKSPPPS